MDTIYLTYQRFLDAAKKFPRWSNLRRRPNNSVSGALLKSIINEIGKVEDAIIEYKKDFFIVNYIGREDKIVDYLYNAQIGNIEDLSQFTLLDPELTVTTDIKEFYANTNYAYYQDGYLVFRNEKENVKYALSNLIVSNCKVINVSMSNSSDLNYQSEVLGNFLNKLITKGYDFVIVQAAGNASSLATDSGLFTGITIPEVRDRIIVVGAIGNNGSHKNGLFGWFGERVFDGYSAGIVVMES